MSIYGRGAMAGGKGPIPLNVSYNGTWNRAGGYSPVTVNIPASQLTSGTKVITADGFYNVTEFKYVRVVVGGTLATTSPIDGISYTNGLPNDWNIMKEIAKAISEASDSINANTTGPIYVNKGNTWAYKITPGDTINVTSQIGTYTYAVMGFNNFALTNQNHYGVAYNTAGLTFGAVDCVTKAKMNSSNTNSGGWEECLMRTSTMPTLQSGMPDTLAQVKVPYVNYSLQDVIVYSDDYLFLPASKEVFGARSYSPSAEADALTQFAYYKNGGNRIKSFSGSAVRWWLRSVDFNDSRRFCGMTTSGNADSYGASLTYGAAPCFCV